MLQEGLASPRLRVPFQFSVVGQKKRTEKDQRYEAMLTSAHRWPKAKHRRKISVAQQRGPASVSLTVPIRDKVAGQSG
jgi:hypothetical protein